MKTKDILRAASNMGVTLWRKSMNHPYKHAKWEWIEEWEVDGRTVSDGWGHCEHMTQRAALKAMEDYINSQIPF